MQAVPREGGTTPEWQESMRMQIDNWADEIGSHSLMSTEVYQSPLWLGLIAQLSRTLPFRRSRLNISTPTSDAAFLASCDAWAAFRALQKKSQIAQPWLVVITQFQAGVTILYIIWARAGMRGVTEIFSEADVAIRYCMSVLAILADWWCNAEVYRDCFEVLARAVLRCEIPGRISRDAKAELGELTEKVSKAGIHGHVKTMLEEMALGAQITWMKT